MTRDTRDMRDPGVLGHLYKAKRGQGWPVEAAAAQNAPRFDGGPFISAPPSEHHLAEHPDVHLLASGEDLSDGAD